MCDKYMNNLLVQCCFWKMYLIVSRQGLLYHQIGTLVFNIVAGYHYKSQVGESN